MVKALGFSRGQFDPTNPGRLCRGRERWIQAWEGEVEPIWRLVVSGAEFSDDSARDARRGLTCAGVTVGMVMDRLFPGRSLLAFKEEGELTRVPAEVQDEDTFSAPRRGGAWSEVCQRWRFMIESADRVDELVAMDALDGLVILRDGDQPDSDLDEELYLLTGMGDGSSLPIRRFQPLVLAGLLDRVDAIVCLHQDKHGPALGIYTKGPMEADETLRALADSVGVLAVPFAIPPMLARWDRALQELRVWWMERCDEEFPVPPAAEPTRWSRLGRRRRPRNTIEE